MRSLYESCHAGYRNYMLDDRITKEMSIICAKYLFFRETKSDLPVDRLFRYTTQLVDGMLIWSYYLKLISSFSPKEYI
jgi:hypothetical protein